MVDLACLYLKDYDGLFLKFPYKPSLYLIFCNFQFIRANWTFAHYYFKSRLLHPLVKYTEHFRQSFWCFNIDFMSRSTDDLKFCVFQKTSQLHRCPFVCEIPFSANYQCGTKDHCIELVKSNSITVLQSRINAFFPNPVC